MNANSRVLAKCKNKVSQPYRPTKVGKKGVHLGIDIIGDNGKSDNTGLLDNLTAHSAGVVVAVQTNVKGYKAGSYGNYVKIKHENGMFTLYAHIAYGTIKVKVGDKVTQGQVIGYMGNTGNSYGAHLHFEVRNINNNKIDPTPYINADLPNNEPKPEPKPEPTPTPVPTPTPSVELKVGDKVKIIKTGKASSYGTGLTAGGIGWTRYITKIYEGRPYPYQVGLKGNTASTATTGFYKAEALQKL